MKVTKLVEGVDVGDDGVEEVLKTALGDVAFDVVIHSAGVLGDGVCQSRTVLHGDCEPLTHLPCVNPPYCHRAAVPR